jgi:tetratricopeptide (TPR) repeat protein|tara:strand:- start:23 stop:973 length:951 start_codon:yes stop_codon:yes gene_type:complete
MRSHVLSILVITLVAGTLAQTALAQGGRLNGVVLDEAGNPIEGAMIIAENSEANPPRYEQATDSLGRYTMLGMASGAWVVTVEVEGFHPNSTTLRLRQGDNPPMAFDMVRIKHPLVVALGEEALEGLDPDQIEQDLADGDAAYNSGEWQVALDKYASLLESLPILNDLNVQIGKANFELENYEDAIAAFEQAVASDPSLEAELETEIARTRMAMGDFDAASDALATAASGDGGSREDLYNLGELEFAKGEIDTAAGWYEKASAADPNWAKPLFKLALVALNRGDIETAKSFFAQVIEKEPNSEEGAQAQATLAALP